jgi:hypothetical protein
MKISYRNYPVLEKLSKGKIGQLELNTNDKDFFFSSDWQFLYSVWQTNAKHFLSDINFICVPFMDASEKAYPKLIELYYNIAAQKEVDLNIKGVFIESGGFTYLYKHEILKSTKTKYTSLYWFDKNTLLGCFYEDIITPSQMWICDNYKRSFNLDTWEKEQKEIEAILGRLTIFYLFKTYAEVETINLPPNSKKEEVNCKYINDTRLPVTFLDSKWFTNLVKSDAFSVRGHFRLQACGHDLKDHKLIWVSEYTKTGYTSPARKLRDDINS